MVVPWLRDENGSLLDERQRELAVLDGVHLLINAGPGSGKTRVLVAHYLHLLMTRTDWDIDAVVAITFTEKAAAEMRERIGKVLQRIAREGQESEWRKRALQLLDHLPEAPIGTIHSFCARLLRQFALEANMDPSFRVLDDLEASFLRRQVSERWLWANLTQPPSDALKRDADLIVAHWGFGRAVNILTDLLKLRLLVECRRSGGKPILCRKGSLTEAEEALERCYEELTAAYDAAKGEIKGLDFDDLLLRTWRLLGDSAEVRWRVRRKHFRILVDELQDIDRVQVEILKLLCGWDAPESHVKFFGVGDGQQSIYSFRNADVSVFNELWEKAQKTYGWQARRLEVNYRSVKPLVTLTNYAFERIFTVSEKDDRLVQRVRTKLQPMVASRQKVTDEPSVEFAFFPLPHPQSKWQRLRVEAEWIARRIAQLKEKGRRYCEVAILLRELINASVYEDALRRHGIPYHIIAGYGFFETMEARDLLTFLQVLAEPDDEVAWFAWLRSPMIGVKDETLFWLREGMAEKIPEEERTKIERAQKWRDEGRQRADRFSVRELLEWILGETSYDTIAAALPQGRQRLANIRKFLRMAQEVSDGLRLTVRGLVRYATALTEGAERIGEPPLAGASTDAVQVMTIHAAKGLEFPVVIVPMLGEVNAPKGSDEVLVADPEQGIALRRYDEAGESLERKAMPNFAAIDEWRQLRERAELERLLFVAWTRAKDLLILVGTSDESAKQRSPKDGSWQSWLQLIQDALRLQVGQGQSGSEIAGVKIRCWGKPTLEATEGAKGATESLGVRWLEEKEPIPELPFPSFDLPQAQPAVLRLSASDLLPQPETQGAGGNGEQAALELGLVVHALLRYGIFEPDERDLRWIAQTVLADSGRVLSRSGDLRVFLRRALDAPSWQETQKAKRRWHELDFRCRLEGEPAIELVGRWDLIADLQTGWLIVDFKTDAVTSSDDAKRKVDEAYRWQALAYAYAAHRVFKASRVRAVFVFLALSGQNEVELCFDGCQWDELEGQLYRRAILRLADK